MVDQCQWIAIHDHTPGESKERPLHVYGSCTCATPGSVLSLRYIEPQGINPKDLRLELTSEPPTGTVPEVLWPCTVEYVHRDATEFDTVSISGDATGTVEVQHPA